MINKIKICVFTSCRAEYGLLKWLMMSINENKKMELKIIATGSHFSEKYGFTYKEIENDGFHIDYKIKCNLDIDEELARTTQIGKLTSLLSENLFHLNPDLVIFMGDRYELLPLITSSILLKIPMGHISGGEITEGAIDEQIRHSATKSSHLHFVANRNFFERVRQMGEESWRICNSGEPGLDALNKLKLLSKKELLDDIGLKDNSLLAIVTYHPETLLDKENSEKAFFEILKALSRSYKINNVRYVITYPNSDSGSDFLIKGFKKFVAEHKECILIKSLGRTRYLSALSTFNFMIGNSSSGLFEGPSFSIPAINIGDRQAGRMRGANVIDVKADFEEINNAIKKVINNKKKKEMCNPYGEGNSSQKIVSFIEKIYSNYSKNKILVKKFIDMK